MSEAALLDDPPVTIAAFDAFLEAQADARPWELVDGQILGMTNPTERHEQIVANIGVPLRQAIGKRPRRVYFGGLRVQRSDNTRGINKPRPDILVRCGVVSTQNYVTDPLIVVEVLSLSTMDIDRGEKLRFYRKLPTLTHIALVYQDQMRVEDYRRVDGVWQMEPLTRPHDALVFEAFGGAVTLEAAYEGVDLGT
jgi:Uma2 family endonuclease